MIGKFQKGCLPIPMTLGITGAGAADIKVLDSIESQMPIDTSLFAGIAYQRGNKPIVDYENFTLYTPPKKEKGQELLDAADKLLSKAISSVRQPIESLFNWIEVKTKLQIASKVRSFEGLMTHIFGKITAGLFMLKERFSS